MKSLAFSFALVLYTTFSTGQTLDWIVTSEQKPWQIKDKVPPQKRADAQVEIITSKTEQVIDGFGTCFNELGWTSLSYLTPKERAEILRELFGKQGARFNICRMPVGANDFSRKWYSYNESDGDFEMKNFTIANDMETLVPFIKAALKERADLRIWASPWSPPSWMKYNKHYASVNFPKNAGSVSNESLEFDFRGRDNGLKPEGYGREGSDMFIQEDRYYKAYALYFSKFIDAYRKEGIRVSMVMPQNEFNSAQVFPSCTWTASGLASFMAHLGPEMEKQKVEMYFGTMERANEKLADTVLNHAVAGKYVKGAGFQWAGKGAIAKIHGSYPQLKLYQTEQECGNGRNDWGFAEYAWSLINHYLSSGANAYLYWNTSLAEGGISSWGWRQNSLVSVDTVKRTYRYNHEYYLMKHFSHYIKPGAKKLAVKGAPESVLSFINPDGSVVVVAGNTGDAARSVTVRMDDLVYSLNLPAHSFNTFFRPAKK